MERKILQPSRQKCSCRENTLFLDWHEKTDIEEETFLKQAKWLFADPGPEASSACPQQKISEIIILFRKSC